MWNKDVMYKSWFTVLIYQILLQVMDAYLSLIVQREIEKGNKITMYSSQTMTQIVSGTFSVNNCRRKVGINENFMKFIHLFWNIIFHIGNYRNQLYGYQTSAFNSWNSMDIQQYLELFVKTDIGHLWYIILIYSFKYKNIF